MFESLLCWTVIWFGLIFAIMLVGAKVFEKKVLPMFKKKAKRLRNFVTSGTLASLAGEYVGIDALMAKFFQDQDETKFRRSTYNSSLSASIFNEMLMKSFSVEIVSQICGWRSDQCENIIKITGRAGNTFYLMFRTGMHTWASSMRQQYKMVEDNGLIPKIDEDNYFEIVQNLSLVHHVDIAQDNPDLEDLYSILSAAQVTYIPVQPSKTMSTNVYRFANGANGYYLQETDQKIKIYSEEMLNKSYVDLPIKYKGQEHTLAPYQAKNIAEIALMNNENVYIFGQMGCGKTTFARQILANLESNHTGVRIISIPPAMLTVLQQPAAQAALIDLLNTKQERFVYDYEEGTDTVELVQVKNIIFIDEAESLLAQESSGLHTEVQAFLLNMMDGELRDTLNCQVILAFNREKEYLNPKVFRSKRAGMEFHMTPIPMDRAKELVKLLKIESPHMRFDAEKFHNFITDITLASDGKMYAAAGFTTLADVVSCFTHPEVDDAIITALRGLNLPKMKKEEAKVQNLKALVEAVQKIPPAPRKARIVPMANADALTSSPSEAPENLKSHPQPPRRDRRRGKKNRR